MSKNDTHFTDGKIDFNYEGATYQTYFKVFGDLENRRRRPLVVLHGGLGFTHDYLISLEELATKYDIPVILYDQLGNGLSTHLREKPPTFWTIDLFVEELVNLINYFGIQDDFDVAGHSSGGCPASELELRRQPVGLKHLILLNSLPSLSLGMQSIRQLIQAFPQDVQEGMAAGWKDLPKFGSALKQFYSVHGCTVRPFPKEYLFTLDQVFGPDGDPTVASAPVLKDWSVIDRLDRIRVPTFVINGKTDMAQDFVVRPFFQKIQKVKWITFENSSHMPFLEEKERFMKLMSEFLEV